MLYVFDRLIEQHEAVSTILSLLDNSSLCFIIDDVEVMKNAVALLTHL